VSGVLAELGLEAENPGTWSGHDGWLADPSAVLVESVNPATGAVLGAVRATTAADYERVMASASTGSTPITRTEGRRRLI